MKEREWNEGLNYIDVELVEEYVEQKKILEDHRERRDFWVRIVSLAACICLIVAALQFAPKRRPGIPLIPVQSSAPRFYGTLVDKSTDSFSGAIEAPVGVSVTAELIKTLPDTYCFLDDWMQHEFRLLRMRTVKTLKGQNVPEEFYYLIPVDFMTDYSAYAQFVLRDMMQCWYENFYLYNRTKNSTERLNLLLFKYNCYNPFHLGSTFTAYDRNGDFDDRLWKSTDLWKAWTETHYEYVSLRIEQAEAKERERAIRERQYHNEKRVGYLNTFTGEAKIAADYVTDLRNGCYVPDLSALGGPITWMQQYQFYNGYLDAIRYINGFPTNEMVNISNSKKVESFKDYWRGAFFTKEDLCRLPNLPSAVASVAAAFDAGRITPSHIVNYKAMQQEDYSIRGWYAKTESGVIGVVRVLWKFKGAERDDAYYDDAFYIIEYGSRSCKPISRDALLDMLGWQGNTFVHRYKYSEKGINYLILLV